MKIFSDNDFFFFTSPGIDSNTYTNTKSNVQLLADIKHATTIVILLLYAVENNSADEIIINCYSNVILRSIIFKEIILDLNFEEKIMQQQENTHCIFKKLFTLVL